MILHNVQTGPGSGSGDICIEEDTITSIAKPGHTPGGIRFEQAIAFPGLINSHDHLDFNSFPALGNKIYSSYVEWAHDIQDRNKEEIAAILRIPKALRVDWSLYKNMLNGITTVVQHGEHFTVNNELIDVFQDCVSLHSVQLEKNWKLRLNKPRRAKWPVVIHTGEGTNAATAAEIDELLRWNLLRRKLIAIHGVAMSAGQAKKFHGLVWCPGSNYFLLNHTANIAHLKKAVPVVFGTDSTLTGHWSIWEQLRIALNTAMVTQQELFDMVTKIPASVWGRPDLGSLEAGKTANIVVAKAKERNYLDSFFALKPEDILLVMHNGDIRMFDKTLYGQINTSSFPMQHFHSVSVNGVAKYVFGDLPGLMKNIRHYTPGIAFPDISIA